MLGWLQNHSSIGPARVHAHWDSTRQTRKTKGPKNKTNEMPNTLSNYP